MCWGVGGGGDLTSEPATSVFWVSSIILLISSRMFPSIISSFAPSRLFPALAPVPPACSSLRSRSLRLLPTSLASALPPAPLCASRRVPCVPAPPPRSPASPPAVPLLPLGDPLASPPAPVRPPTCRCGRPSWRLFSSWPSAAASSAASPLPPPLPWPCLWWPLLAAGFLPPPLQSWRSPPCRPRPP